MVQVRVWGLKLLFQQRALRRTDGNVPNTPCPQKGRSMFEDPPHVLPEPQAASRHVSKHLMGSP